MGDFYCKSSSGVIAYSLVTFTTGMRMVPTRGDVTTNVAVARTAVWECTTGGTPSATPTWPASITYDTTTVTQNGVVWTARKPGFSSGSTIDWTFATPYADYCTLAGPNAGDVNFLSSSHAESDASAKIITTAGWLISVAENGSSRPTTLTAGASITTTGSNNLDFRGNGMYAYGITATGGTGTGNPALGIGSASVADQNQIYDTCALRQGATGTSARINIGNSIASTNGGQIRFVNTTARFGNASQGCTVGACLLSWNGGGLESGGTAPSVLFVSLGAGSARSPEIAISGVDFSGLGASANLFTSATLSGAPFCSIRNSIMPASWTGDLCSGTPNSPGTRFEGDNLSLSSSGGATVNKRIKDFYGTVQDDRVIVQGANPYSWNLTAASNPVFPFGLRGPELEFYIAAGDVGVLKTLTVPFLTDGSTDMNDDDLSFDIQYPGNSGNVQSVSAKIAKASVLATATAHASDSGTTWTTTGVTTPHKQKAVGTFTPQQAGVAYATPKLHKASQSLWLSPFATVS